MAAYARGVPRSGAKSCGEALRGELPRGWDADMPVFPADAKGMATRVASGKVMNAIAPRLPALTGGSADLDPSTHTALKGLGDFNPAAGKDDRHAGLRRRRLELRRAQPSLRRARARDGRDRQRHGGARRNRAVRRDVPDLLRLHAPADPAGGADGPARHARVHPRQHRARRGRPHPSAGGAAGRAARDSESDRDPPRRRQRNRGRVARRAGDARSSGAAGAEPAGRADARSQPLRARRRPAPRRVCAVATRATASRT